MATNSNAEPFLAGIIRCDMIAESIVAAAENFQDIPVVVRLQGTNSAEGQRIVSLCWQSDYFYFGTSFFASRSSVADFRRLHNLD